MTPLGSWSSIPLVETYVVRVQFRVRIWVGIRITGTRIDLHDTLEVVLIPDIGVEGAILKD